MATVPFFSTNSRGDYFAPGAPIGRESSQFSNFRGTVGAGFSTPDLQALFANTERSRLAHDVLTRARKEEADRDLDLLRRATPDSIRSLFSQPKNQNDFELQRIINRDVIGKELGAQMIPNWKMMQQYESGILSNLARAEGINDSRFSRDLRTDQLEQQQARDIAALFNQTQQREHARQQFELDKQKFGADQAYRNAALERDRENQRRADQRLVTRDFVDVQNAVRRGVMTADEALAALPNMTPAQRQSILGYDSQSRAQAEQAQLMASLFNQQIQRSLPQTTPGRPGLFGTSLFSKASVDPSAEEIAAARDAKIQELFRMPGARNQVFINPQTGLVEPLLRHAGAERPLSDVELMLRNQRDPVPPELRGANENPILPAWRSNEEVPAYDSYDGPVFLGGMTDIQSGPFPGEPPNFLHRLPQNNPPLTASATPASVRDNGVRASIQVPPQFQSRYENGRVYIINGQNYRYQNGQMVR